MTRNHLVGYTRKLQHAASGLRDQIHAFGRHCRSALIRHREDIIDAQYVQARLGDAATELFVASCVYSRLCAFLEDTRIDRSTGEFERTLQTGLLSLQLAEERNRQRFRELKSGTDQQKSNVAGMWLQTQSGEQK